MRPSFVTLAALAALSGKYVVDARALSNNLARIVSSVATHDLDTVLYEKQKREVILPNTPRAQPGVPAVPAPKVPTGPAPKPPAVPAPKPPSTPDKPGVPEPVAPELGRPEPGRPEPGRPEPGSPGGNPEGELPANEQVAPADLVQLEQGCAKAKRDAGLPLYGADLEHSQLRGRSPDDRSRKTPRDALQKRGSDEFARTKPEWQDMYGVLDYTLQNDPTVTKPIFAYTMGGIPAVFDGVRGPDGATADTDIYLHSSVDGVHRTALTTAVEQVHATNSENWSPNFVNTELEKIFNTDETKNFVSSVSQEPIWSGQKLVIINIKWSVQVIRKLQVLYSQDFQWGGQTSDKDRHDTAAFVERFSQREKGGQKITLEDLRYWGSEGRSGQLPDDFVDELVSKSVRHIVHLTDKFDTDVLQMAGC